MKLEITNRKQVGTLDFFTVIIGGITVDDCKLMNGSKGPWIAGPSAAMLTKEKTLLMKDGKGQYKNPVKFSNEVQQAIIAALEGGEVQEPPPVQDEEIPF